MHLHTYIYTHIYIGTEYVELCVCMYDIVNATSLFFLKTMLSIYLCGLFWAVLGLGCCGSFYLVAVLRPLFVVAS